MSKKINLVWFRNDLRVGDNPALFYAAEKGTVIGIYLEPVEQREAHDDAPCKVGFINDTVKELRKQLNKLNIPLQSFKVIDYQQSVEKIEKLVAEYEADGVYFNNEYPLNEKERDDQLEKRLQEKGLEVNRFDGDVIIPPSSVSTGKGAPYKVFTPYKKAWIEFHKTQGLSPLPEPDKQDFKIEQQHEYYFAQEYREELWPAGEKAARDKLNEFLPKAGYYKERRDIPSVKGTSMLSPYLAVGAISAKQCIEALLEWHEGDQEAFYQDTWLSEMIWREFYRQIIIDNPQISRHQPFKRDAKEVWNGQHELFVKWCKGETGFPLIDAAMRQLINTGWMHNRLRMNVAMFLNKLCLIDWREGEAFFMRQLIDGDFASNNGGWQWCSSTGADGAPYFRIMSPITQSQRFDPEGNFIRKLVPELASLSDKDIHFPNSEQRKELGYPEPIIDYKAARKTALELLS
ncbi:cryptochrome/photolyase family protein [Kangiella sp.]|uniref:cryptochrome/photolyase family protein n=1 Tax=Kangiella sp. TaxID=1920245 RepID=UPI003A91B125